MENQAGSMVTKLKGETNWNIWKFQTVVTAESRGYLEVLTGENKIPQEEGKEKILWKALDAKAKELLVTRMEEEAMVHILHCKTSYEMWNKLLTIYEQKSDTSVHMLHEKFFNFQYLGNGVADHISSLMDIVTKLKTYGEDISERQIITKILMSLPIEFKHFISAWESVNPERQTINELTSRLIIEETRSSSSNPGNQAFVAINKSCTICHKRGHMADKCFKNKNNSTNLFKCHFCNKPGHFKRDCFLFKNKNKDQKEENNYKNAFISMACMGNSIPYKDKFYLDSGASEHMSPVKEFFSQLKPCSKVIKIGDGRLLKAHGCGDIDVLCKVGNETIQSILKDVLYVPDLKLNLFSVSQALSKGHTMMADNDACRLMKNDTVKAEASREGQLFVLNMIVNREGMAAIAEIDPEVSHKRIAHQNVNRIKEISTKINIGCSDNEETLNCDSSIQDVGMIPVKENQEVELSRQIVEPSLINGHQTDIFKGNVCNDSVMMGRVNDVKMVLRVPPRAKLGCRICKGPEWKPGVFVQFTKENSIARQAGLRPGDQILQCNNFVFTPETLFNEAVSVMRCSGVLELEIRKGAGLELFPGESSGYNSSGSRVAGDNSPRLAVLQEECNGAINAATNGSDRLLNQEVLKIGRMDYQNGCTVIHVGSDETDNEKIADICMVSQQLETKTTTVSVEVHHSEDDTVSNTQSEASTDRLSNSSSVSSLTSSVSSAISEELERRSKPRSLGNESLAETLKQAEKLINSGLVEEKVEQHEQLMMEFKKACRKMFSSVSDSTINNEKREEDRVSEKNNQNGLLNENSNITDNGNKEVDTPKTKRQTAIPPPPPLPDEKTLEKQNPQSSKKHAPPYCPTPNYDTASLAYVGKRRVDIVEMRSLESFKLTNPSTVKPKPPSTYFSCGQLASEQSSGTVLLKEVSKPIVTIWEYPRGRERKNPLKFDFLQNSPKGAINQDEPITSRLQNELCQTLSRATTLSKNNNECTSEFISGHQNGNGSVETVVTINLSPHQKSDSNKPFYLFPNENPLNSVDI